MTDTPEPPALEPEETVPFVEHELVAPLRAALGAGFLESHQKDKELWVRVDVAAWADAAKALQTANFRYFSFLSGIDWQPNPNLDGEKVYTDGLKPMPDVIVDPVIRLGGGTSRFQVFARVANVDTHRAVTVLCDLGDDLKAPSWTRVYRGADWHEREAAEMFGFDFGGHPGLRHLYLPEEFEGYPLRKDFPLAARVVRPWPGLVDMEEMPTAEANDE